jgi:hypothetical protein
LEHLTLQIVGGTLYLLNKVFLNLMERRRGNVEQFWLFRKLTWAVYLLGLPPIVAIFFIERDWIFGLVELGGAPAMLCGLIAAFNRKSAPKWLDRLAIAAVPVGFTLSVWDFGGITTLTQFLEILGSAGFLVGTYLLAKDRQSGYYWFLIMNVTTGVLLGIQGYYLFIPQQALSILLILDAYRVRKTRTA